MLRPAMTINSVQPVISPQPRAIQPLRSSDSKVTLQGCQCAASYLRSEAHEPVGGGPTIDRTMCALALVYLDDQRQRRTEIRCAVCALGIYEPVFQRLTKCEVGAIEMCSNPDCMGYFRLVQTEQDRLGVQLGQLP